MAWPVLSLLAGCEDALSPRSYRLELVDGDAQTGALHGPAARPLAVRAVDEDERPVAGVRVAWRVLEGGAGIPVTAVATDSLGLATTEVVFGGEPGPVMILAEAAEDAVRFRLAGERHWRSAGAGLAHTCVLSHLGEVYCWGANDVAQLGDGSETERATPAPVAGRLELAALAVGWLHTCGIEPDGAVVCWGSNDFGQLGVGDRGVRHRPTRVPLDEGAVALAAGYLHPCAVVWSGAAYCWGSNAYGALGSTAPMERCAGSPCATRPVRVASDAELRAVAAGEFHSCALTSAGAAYCWGWNYAGEIGNGDVPGGTYRTPERVLGEQVFTQVSAHSRHTCAVTTAGEGYCWGRSATGEAGQLGNWWSPVPLTGGLAVRGISTGNLYTCATLNDQRTACFGDQSGRVATLEPRILATPAFTDVAVGFGHSCGVFESHVRCWGSNGRGQLGPLATAAYHADPVDVPLPL